MIRYLLLFILLVSGVTGTGGCQKKGVVRPQGVQPFTPVHIEFNGHSKDASVEEMVAKRLFCKECLFIKAAADTGPPAYTLSINYDRRMDLKSLGFVVLSAALAPIDAEFTYTLFVDVLKNGKMLKEYEYTQQTQEETNSAFGEMFYPFYDENGRSEEVFAALIDRFLHDVMRDKPLPLVKSLSAE